MTRSKTLALLAALTVAALGSPRAHAATFTVSNLNDNGVGSLRQAILDSNAAPGADRIVFGAFVFGTIILTSGELRVAGQLDIDGPGREVLAIDGDGNSRVLRIDAGNDTPVAVSGLTLRNGKAPGDDFPLADKTGGGILNFSALTLTNCTLSGNRARDGGAVYNHGALTVDSCLLIGNRADELGGGIFHWVATTLALANSAFIGNRASGGGGIATRLSGVVLTNCTLSSNSAQGDGAPSEDRGGGGIACFGSRMTLTDCALTGNSAEVLGGGFLMKRGEVTLTRCSISGNSAVKGGGILNNIGTATLVNSSVSDNVARPTLTTGQHGGGIHNTGVTTLSLCTLSGNRAAHNGGAIRNEGDMLLTSCEVAGNEALYGGGIINYLRLTLIGATFSGNTARFGGGGALYNAPATGIATLTGCTFTNNIGPDQALGQDAAGGGAIQNRGSLMLAGCTLSANSAQHGGAIRNFGSATLSRCTLFANFAVIQGGALHNQEGAMTVDLSTIAGNGTGNVAAGVYNSAELTVMRSTLNGNVAAEGGGLYNEGGPPIDDGDPAPAVGTLTIGNSTFSGNRAFAGGGLFNKGRVLMANCTLFRNHADEGGGIRNLGGGQMKVGNTLLASNGAGGNAVSDGGSFLTSFGGNLDSDGTCGFGATQDQSGTPGAPLDPMLGPLQNNAGPTQTHALLPGSPAIDAGIDAERPGDTDQRGFRRIADGDRDGTARIDIGAFELSFFGFRELGGPPWDGFLSYSTIEAPETSLPAGTTSYNLTIHYGEEIAHQTFVAMLNGQNITHLFHAGAAEGFETVAIPLREGPNRLILRVKGRHDGRPAQDVDSLGFRVGEPPFGPR